MSSDTIYPDNPNRRRRVNQLATQIQTTQSKVKLSYGGNKNQEVTIKKKLDVILQQHGVRSIPELLEKLKKQADPKVMKQYERMVQRFKDQDSDLQNTIDIIGGVSTVAGIVGGTAKGIEFIACGELAAATATAIKAMTVMEKDFGKAMRLLKVAATALKEFVGGIEVGGVAAKALKFVKLAGTVLGAVSVVLDGVLLIIAAFKGAEEREQLRNAIHDLVHRRMSTETISIMAEAYTHYMSNLYVVCMSLKNHPKDAERIKDEMVETVKDLHEELKSTTFEKVWKALEDLDKGQNTWTGEETGDHPVVTKEIVGKWWDEENDPKKFNPHPTL